MKHYHTPPGIQKQEGGKNEKKMRGTLQKIFVALNEEDSSPGFVWEWRDR